MSQTGMLIILTGPTASGKDAVMKKLLEQNPNWGRIITTTTRSPRPGETEGKDYFFVSKETFQEMQKNEEFLEDIEYSGNYYGTTKKEIERVLKGENVIWRIDPTFAAKVQEYFKQVFDSETAQQLIDHTKVFFIKIPDQATLQRRLKARGMNEQDIEQRFQQDSKNWEDLKDKFENVIINEDGKLDETVEKILHEIRIKNAQYRIKN